MSGGNFWTEAEDQQLLAGLAAGDQSKVIGARMGRTSESVLTRICALRKAGVDIQTIKAKARQARIERLKSASESLIKDAP